MRDAISGADDPDAQLMLLVAQGNVSAFRTLVDKYQGPLTNFLNHMLLDRAEAEDAAQDVFLNVYRAASRYRADARFATWLYRIATNTALNSLKARRRKPTVSLDALVEQQGGDGWASSSSDRADVGLQRAELSRAIQRALGQLPERQRIAVVLHRFEGLSYREISDVLSTSVDAVDGMLRRAKTELRQALTPWL